ncbi:hypothetical protein Tco_0745913 [Tanacetum coccineum]
MPLSIKSQNDSFRFEHELKTEMHEDFEYVKSLEKEIDELESEKYQKEVKEIYAKSIIAKNANPLALVAAAQQYPYPYYQAPKPHKSYAPPSKQSSSTRSNATTK